MLITATSIPRLWPAALLLRNRQAGLEVPWYGNIPMLDRPGSQQFARLPGLSVALPLGPLLPSLRSLPPRPRLRFQHQPPHPPLRLQRELQKLSDSGIVLIFTCRLRTAVSTSCSGVAAWSSTGTYVAGNEATYSQ